MIRRQVLLGRNVHKSFDWLGLRPQDLRIADHPVAIDPEAGSRLSNEKTLGRSPRTSFEPAAESVPALLRRRTSRTRSPAWASRTRRRLAHGNLARALQSSRSGHRLLGRLGCAAATGRPSWARTRREWQVAVEMSALPGRSSRDRTARRARADTIRPSAFAASFLVADNAQMISAIPQDGLAGISRVIVFDGPALRSGRQTALAGSAPGACRRRGQRIPARR